MNVSNERKTGAIISYINVAATIITGLLVTPFIIEKVGKNEYGVYNIIGSFVIYLNVIASSFANTVVRYISKFRAKNDKQSEQHVLGFLFIINMLLALTICLLGFSLRINIISLFSSSLTHEELILADRMFVIMLINTVLIIGFNTFNGIVIAYERFCFIKSLELLNTILSNIIIVSLLFVGFKAYMLVIVTSAFSISILICKIIYSFKNLKINFDFIKIEKKFAIEIILYVLSILIVAISDNLYWKFGNIVIGMTVSSTAVAIFAIGMSFHKYFMSFSTTISKVLVPKIMIDIDRGVSIEELTNTLIKISRLQALILSIILSGLILFGYNFILLWVGRDFSDAYYVMLLTLIPFSIDISCNVRNTVIEAKNLAWYRSAIIFTCAILNIALSVLLLKTCGIISAAIGTGVGITIGYMATSMLLQIKANINFSYYLKGLFKGIIPNLFLCLAIGVVFFLFPKDTWLQWSIQVLIYSIIIVFLTWKIAMNDYEKQLIRGLLKK